ncbi:unnamed protein product [Prunus armeniaca]|uniref:cytochrome-b5 reductase n=1 Tax=Prunus armeniaca TaxID=36596 RepID=A0A6J5UVM5_PRUAR|nr:unnamed protein product [Prunus armeniaca]
MDFIESLDPQILLGSLDAENFKDFKLVKRTQLSHNVAKFRFELPTSTSVLGLPIGQHISCRGKDSQGEDVIKPYTPTTLDSDVGYFELVIKMYPQGRMSHHFREMRVGDHLAVKGPKGRFKYQPGQVRAFGMLAGGSGITPMFQYVARAILENPKTNKGFFLHGDMVFFMEELLSELFCGEGSEVVLSAFGVAFWIYFCGVQNICRKMLLVSDWITLRMDGLTSNYPDRFKIYYVLNQPPEVWDGGVGFVTKEMIQAQLPAPAHDIQTCICLISKADFAPGISDLRCGPPPMNKAMAAHLEALGYAPEMQFQSDPFIYSNAITTSKVLMLSGYVMRSLVKRLVFLWGGIGTKPFILWECFGIPHPLLRALSALLFCPGRRGPRPAFGSSAQREDGAVDGVHKPGQGQSKSCLGKDCHIHVNSDNIALPLPYPYPTLWDGGALPFQIPKLMEEFKHCPHEVCIGAHLFAEFTVVDIRHTNRIRSSKSTQALGWRTKATKGAWRYVAKLLGGSSPWEGIRFQAKKIQMTRGIWRETARRGVTLQNAGRENCPRWEESREERRKGREKLGQIGVENRVCERVVPVPIKKKHLPSIISTHILKSSSSLI